MARSVSKRVPGESAMRRAQRDISRRALKAMVSEAALLDNLLLDSIADSPVLGFTDESLPISTGEVLSIVCANLPEALSLMLMPLDNGSMILDLPVPVMIVAKGLKDSAGEPWMAVSAVMPVGRPELTDGFSLDDHVNDLNLEAIGYAFAKESQSVVACTGSTVKLSNFSARWAHLTAMLIADMVQDVTAIFHVPGVDDSLKVEYDAQRLLSSATGIGWDPIHVFSQARAYTLSLPPRLQPLFSCHIQPDAAVDVLFPLPDQESPKTGRVRVFPADASRGGRGLGVFAALPRSFEHKDALDWATRLNDGDSAALNDGLVHTTQWLHGAWVASLEGKESIVVYRGFIPDSYEPFCTLEEVIEGVVHELAFSWRRFKLDEDFKLALGGDW